MNMLNQELAEPPASAGNSQERETYRMMLAWKAKYVQALEVQNTMEAELEQLSTERDQLVAETSKLKTEKQNQDMELAQVTKQLINGQGTYMQQISSLSEEVSSLRIKNRNLEQKREILEQKIEDLSQPASMETPTRPDNNLLTEEVLNHHNKLKHELEQIKEVNERLEKENDAFQLLLSENTISGQFPSFEIEGETLDNELQDEIMDTETPDTTKDPKFELRSAQNHIRALKLSLESLVQRLLENPDFEKAIELNIGSRKVSAFTERRRQAAGIVEQPIHQPKYAPDEQAYWSNLLTPKKRNNGTRTFSMGVDERLSDSSSFSESGSTLVSEIQLPKRPSATSSQTSLRKLSLS